MKTNLPNMALTFFINFIVPILTYVKRLLNVGFPNGTNVYLDSRIKYRIYRKMVIELSKICKIVHV